MKNSFPGYYRPTKEEFSESWKNCLFVLDANVLLNLYRYSPETSEELSVILNKISDRLWVPHQAALEYQKHRPAVIGQQAAAYDDILDLLRRKQQELGKQLRSRMRQGRHPLMEVDRLVDSIKNIFTEEENELNELKQKHLDLLDKDHIRDDIDALLEGKVGSPYSPEKLEKIYKTGETRYEQHVPPGFKDVNKEGKKKYGDLVLWFQIIDKARETKKPIILVTDDRKEDWWWKAHGRTIGPYPHLRQEMISDAGVSFYMYGVSRFMEYAREYLELEVKQEAIDEALEVRRRDEEYMKAVELPTSRLDEIARAMAKAAADQDAAYRRSLEGLYKRLELPTSRLDEIVRAMGKATGDQDAAYRQSLERLHKSLQLPISRLDEIVRATAKAAADQDAAYRQSLERLYKDLGMGPPPTGRETTEEKTEGSGIPLDSEPEEEPDASQEQRDTGDE